MRRILTLSLAGLMLAVCAAFTSTFAAAPDARSVTTEPVVVPPSQAGDGSDSAVPADPAPDAAAPDDNGDQPGAETPDQPEPMEIPTVEYDLSKLPAPVKRLREQIIEAATTGDIEKLRPIVDANGEPPDFGTGDTGDPIGDLKLQSGDAEGREILAILIEVLDAGYVHVDVGTPDEVYLWPYFARYPIDKLSPQQLVELFKLVYAGDYQDMLGNGVYDYFRAGIAPNGTWKFFVAGD